MERYLSNPNVDKTVVNVIQVYEGGTGGTTVEEAQKNLDILDKSQVNVPGGLAISTGDGLFGDRFEGGFGDTPMIEGPAFVRTNQTNRFFITNYDIKTDYEISSSMGSISREGDILIFKSGPDVGVALIKVNNLEVKLDIYMAIINMPFILTPDSGRKDINSKVEITTSQFITQEENTRHFATDWQLSTTVTMDNIFKSVEKDRTYLTNWMVEGLQENITYYIRFRYHDNVGNKSSWSEITQFTTRVSFAPQRPTIVLPAIAAKEIRSDVNVVGTDFKTFEVATHVSTDWQISTSSVFAGLIAESEEDEVNLRVWPVKDLKPKTLYYVRVRYKDNKGRKSDWSLVSRFTTKDSFAAETPIIIAPADESDSHNSRVEVRAYPFTNGDSRVTHATTDWEISEDTSFQYPAYTSYANGTAKVNWLAQGLLPGKTYYVRARFRDSMGFQTEWSKPVKFSTKVSFNPKRPSVTAPSNSKTDVGPYIELRSSAYSSNNLGDEHLDSDWQVGTNLNFTDVVFWNTATSKERIVWLLKGLKEASQYFVRVRHRSTIDGTEYVSDWSGAVNFSTKDSFKPGKPEITYPKSGSADINANVNITSTNFKPNDPQDVHVNSDWEISTNSAYTDIVQSNYGSAVAKTLWQVTNLRSLTTFFIRVRHRSVNDGVYYVSDWSSSNNFTVEHNAPAKPTITNPSNGSKNVATNVTFTCSEFNAGEEEEKHFSSTWELATDGAFTSVISTSLNSTSNKTSWTPSGLENSKNYFVRVKHIGSLGFESEWSDTCQFTTKAAVVSNTPNITSPSLGATNVNTTVQFTSSSFSTNEPTNAHVSSDWVLALDANFSTVVKSETASTTSRTLWSVTGLSSSTTYYVRVRYTASETGLTGWSATVSFTTKAPESVGQVVKPSITSPSNGATNLGTSFQITSSSFSSTVTGDAHMNTDWEVSTDISFGSVVKSNLGSTSNRTSWNVGGLSNNSTYYIRVRHRGEKGGTSAWSDPINVRTVASTGGGGGTTPTVTVNTPAITSPSNGASGLGPTLTVTSSNFSSSGSDTHKASDWEISTNSGFTTVVKSSYGSTTELTSWGVTGLQANLSYYVRVKHYGNSGAVSDWSTAISFNTTVVETDIQISLEKYPLKPGVVYPSMVFSKSSKHTVAAIASYLDNGLFTGAALNTMAFGNDGKYIATKHFGGGGSDAFNYDSGDNLGSILAAQLDAVGNEFISTFTRTARGAGGYLTTIIDTWSNNGPLFNFAFEGVNPLGSIGGYSKHVFLNKEFNKAVANKTGYVSGDGDGYKLMTTMIQVGKLETRDNNTSFFSTVGNWNAPPNNYPDNYGILALMSPNGKLGIVTAGFNYVYIFEEIDSVWTFKEKFQLPEPPFTADMSEDGNTLVFGIQGRHAAMVYTRVNGKFSSAPIKLEPEGGGNTKYEYLNEKNDVISTIDLWYHGGYASVSEDGNTITVSAKGTYARIFVYKKQPDGTYKQKAIVGEPMNPLGRANDYNYLGRHQLSYDGTRIGYLSLGYTVYSGSNRAIFEPEVVFATLNNGSVGSVSVPSITAPSNGATVDASSLTVTSSGFSSSIPGDSHLNSSWEIATDSGFATVVKSSYNSTTNLTSFTTGGLAEGATFYARVRYTGSKGSTSPWSSAVSFKTGFVNIPGANGYVKYKVMDRFRYDSFMSSKSTQTFVNTGGSTGYFFKLNMDGTITEPVIFAGGGDYTNRVTAIYGSMFSEDDSRWFVCHGLTIPVASSAENVVSFTAAELGLAVFVKSSLKSELSYEYSSSKTLDDVVIVKIGIFLEGTTHLLPEPSSGSFNKRIDIGQRLVSDSGLPSYKYITSITIPEGHLPEGFGYKVIMSGDGNTLGVMAFYNFIYLYERIGGIWTFIEKVQFAQDAFKIDISDDGKTIIIGVVREYKAILYTKKNGTWNNPTVIVPNGAGGPCSYVIERNTHNGIPITLDLTHLRIGTWVGISGDAKTISICGKKPSSNADFPSILIYRLQPNGSYGEVKAIDLQFSEIGAPEDPAINYSQFGKHFLSRDGTRVVYLTLPLEVTQGENKVVINGDIALAY